MTKIKRSSARLKSCTSHVCLPFPLLRQPAFFALVKVCPSKHLVSRNRGHSMKIPQQVTCQCSSENCSAVATNENQFIQVLDLQPIVQRVAKAMRPVKQRQETQCKQINSGERQRDQRMQILVTRSGNPSQGKRKPEEEKVHRYDESRKDTARAEQRPQNRFIRLLRHLRPHEKPCDHQRDCCPGGIICAHNPPVGHPRTSQANGHLPRRQAEPGYGMKTHKEQGD